MEKKKLQNISIAALIISVLPFATLIPVFLQIVLPDGLRTVWGCVNIVCVIIGLCLSIICVLLLMLVIGIIILALFLSFLQVAE